MFPARAASALIGHRGWPRGGQSRHAAVDRAVRDLRFVTVGSGKPDGVTTAPQPWPALPLSEPPSDSEAEGLTEDLPGPAADVEVVLHGSIAVVTGVVEEAGDRRRIVEAIASLESISEVEDNLRPPAA